MYLDFIKAKNDYIAASRRAFECGLAAASGGNISVRLPGEEKMIVKPSGITLGLSTTIGGIFAPRKT